MKKKLIFCAYAYDDTMKSGENVKEIENKQELYLKNAVVALVSAKTYNPDCEVAIVSNISIPKKYIDLLDSFNILVFYEPFNEYRFDSNFSWGLAFYKLCALKKMLSRNYSDYLLLDTDTYTQSSLNDMWSETKDNILLYDINHRASNLDCITFNNELSSMGIKKKNITNYGGEFIAGSRELLEKFIYECDDIFKQMKKMNVITKMGDEFVIRIAADRLKLIIKNGGGYIFRFWTGSFYLVSTCYKFNQVSILHVPREKKHGMLNIFNYLNKNGKLPSNNKIYKMLSLNKPTILIRLKIYLNKYKNKYLEQK